MDVHETFHMGNVGGHRCHLSLHDARGLVLGASNQSRIQRFIEEADWHHILVHILLSLLCSE